MIPAEQAAARGAADAASRRWLDGLRSDGERREQTVRDLHAHLLAVARHEVNRRRGWLDGAGGPELDDLAHQAAGDAFLAIDAKLDTYRGASRFTTWAYKFVMHQVSDKTRRRAWSGRRVVFDDADWEQLPDRLLVSAERRQGQRAQLEELRKAVDEALTPRQRDVFIAVALNEVPIDVVAQRLGSNRGALYKTLHDARTKLRASLAAAGYPVESEPHRS